MATTTSPSVEAAASEPKPSWRWLLYFSWLVVSPVVTFIIGFCLLMSSDPAKRRVGRVTVLFMTLLTVLGVAVLVGVNAGSSTASTSSGINVAPVAQSPAANNAVLPGGTTDPTGVIDSSQGCAAYTQGGESGGQVAIVLLKALNVGLEQHDSACITALLGGNGSRAMILSPDFVNKILAIPPYAEGSRIQTMAAANTPATIGEYVELNIAPPNSPLATQPNAMMQLGRDANGWYVSTFTNHP